MRIVTWNLQGSNASTENKWNEGLLPLMREDGIDADILCVQECGAVPASARLVRNYNQRFSLWTWGGTHSRPGVYILFYYWDDGANRCNLAVVSKTEPQDPKALFPEDNPWRPVIGGRFGDVYVFSLHAISPGGRDVERLLEAVADGDLEVWLVAGDFNREPDHTFPNGGWIVCPPNGATHPAQNPQRSFDYAVVCAGYGSPVVGHVLSGYMSDHRAVCFDF